MKKLFLIMLVLLVIVNMAIFFESVSFVSAGVSHGVNGLVLDADDGVFADGSVATFQLVSPEGNLRTEQTLEDIVGFGNANKSNWYFIDVGNFDVQWQENDFVLIFIEKDSEHNASTDVILTKTGNDQAPTVKLSSPQPLQICGDGNCAGTENCLNCSEDCPPLCNNNKICEAIPNATHPLMCENIINCAADCFCNPPDGFCDELAGESFINCPEDCYCGNWICEEGAPFYEDNETCPEDCRCGNEVCDWEDPFNETSLTCPEDCSPGYCGNEICEAELGEDQVTCPEDCALLCDYDDICEFGEFYPFCPDCEIYCGNMICDVELGETYENCPSDCPPLPVCGDGVCNTEIGENWTNCPVDCYALFARCGDRKCELAENQDNCCVDCDCPPTITQVFECVRNRCIPQCCFIGICRQLFICWYWLALIVIAIAIIILILFKTKVLKFKHKKRKRK